MINESTRLNRVQLDGTCVTAVIYDGFTGEVILTFQGGAILSFPTSKKGYGKGVIFHEGERPV